MKRIFLSALIGIGMVALIFQILSGSAAGQRRTFPLVCRGGGSIAPSTVRIIGVTFTRGTKPAGEGLDPGECSWVDRGMHADEPDRLSQPVEDSWESLDKGEGGRLLPPETRWYEELRSSRKSWRFMVYRQRSVLRVTSAGSQG